MGMYYTGETGLSKDKEGLEYCASILEAILPPNVRDITDEGKGYGGARQLDIWKSSTSCRRNHETAISQLFLWKWCIFVCVCLTRNR